MINFLCHKCKTRFEKEAKECETKKWTWMDMHSYDYMITYKAKCPKCNNNCEEDFILKEN